MGWNLGTSPGAILNSRRGWHVCSALTRNTSLARKGGLETVATFRELIKDPSERCHSDYRWKRVHLTRWRVLFMFKYTQRHIYKGQTPVRHGPFSLLIHYARMSLQPAEGRWSSRCPQGQQTGIFFLLKQPLLSQHNRPSTPAGDSEPSWTPKPEDAEIPYIKRVALACNLHITSPILQIMYPHPRICFIFN